MVAVGVHLQHDRPGTAHAVLFRELRRLLHRQSVHAVDFQTGHVIASFVVLRALRGLFNSRAHPVVIVLAHVNQRKVPQRGDVQRLEELTLVRGAVAVHGDGDVGLFFVLHGKREARADGRLRADDAVASKKMRISFVHVHRAAHASGSTIDAPHELRHHLQRRAAAAEVRAVVAVGRDDGVILGERGFHADAHRLLAVVQVAEPADELALVQHVGRNLQPAH